MINESNYHIYLDEFVAGLLDEEMEMDFVAFLDQHPGILEDETLDDAVVTLSAGFQESLKREIPLDAQHIDEYLIASLEGDLSTEQEADLAKFIAANPQFEKNQELIQLTKIEADTSLVYSKKTSLKKRPVMYLYTRWAASAAAVFVLGMMIFKFLGSGEIPQQELAVIPVPLIPSIELPAIHVSARSTDSNQSNKNEEGPNYPRELVAATPITQRTQEKVPEQLKKQDVDLNALELPELPDLNLMPVAITSPSSLPEEQFASHSSELTVFQWAYKKLRGKIGAPEVVVPERDIPQDVANIVMAKVAPIFQVAPNGSGSRIRIGGIEINRRTAH